MTAARLHRPFGPYLAPQPLLCTATLQPRTTPARPVPPCASALARPSSLRTCACRERGGRGRASVRESTFIRYFGAWFGPAQSLCAPATALCMVCDPNSHVAVMVAPCVHPATPLAVSICMRKLLICRRSKSCGSGWNLLSRCALVDGCRRVGCGPVGLSSCDLTVGPTRCLAAVLCVTCETERAGACLV